MVRAPATHTTARRLRVQLALRVALSPALPRRARRAGRSQIPREVNRAPGNEADRSTSAAPNATGSTSPSRHAQRTTRRSLSAAPSTAAPSTGAHTDLSQEARVTVRARGRVSPGRPVRPVASRRMRLLCNLDAIRTASASWSARASPMFARPDRSRTPRRRRRTSSPWRPAWLTRCCRVQGAGDANLARSHHDRSKVRTLPRLHAHRGSGRNREDSHMHMLPGDRLPIRRCPVFPAMIPASRRCPRRRAQLALPLIVAVLVGRAVLLALALPRRGFGPSRVLDRIMDRILARVSRGPVRQGRVPGIQGVGLHVLETEHAPRGQEHCHAQSRELPAHV